MKSVLVTGSAGLIGSEAVRFYNARAANVVGVDNNLRETFFGPDGDTSWRRAELEASVSRYTHVAEDIRDFERMERLITRRGRS